MFTEKKQFRLIGVRPLKGCAAHIRKILKEDTTYFLYDDFEIDNKNPETVIYKGHNNIPPNFFSEITNPDSPLISISAIVGKNGDGKSTIVELIIRILNNFAYASGYKSYQYELKAIKGLKAILYFSIDNIPYYIKDNGSRITSNFFDEILSIKSQYQDVEFLKRNQDLLFYSQISNFSLYAYNANEFNHENFKPGNCWINGIFHKNDAYQTPIVLNPWRDNGVIDINKENYLMNQRLVSLFVDSDNGKDSFRNIDDKKEAKYIVSDLYPESKLLLKTYKDYFIDTYKFEENYFLSQIMDAKEVKIFHEGNNYKSFIEDHIYKLKNIKQIIELNQKDFDFAFKIFKSISNKYKTKKSDFKDYLIQLKKTIVSINTQDKKSLLKLVSFFTKNKYNELNLLQLQRIIIVITIRNLWHKKYPGYFSSESTYGDNSISKSEQYIIYKTISIIIKYPQYRSLNNISIQDTFNTLFEYESYYNHIESTQSASFEKLQNDIDKGRSHVTLKIRQTINYLSSLAKKELEYIKQSDINSIIIDSLTLSREIYKETSYIIDLTEYKKRIDNISGKQSIIGSTDTIDFLPPPIFGTNILFQHINSSNEYSFLSQFSSGEKQMLNNVSSTIYHLRNINSVSNPELIKYKHINLIFEEIELYFHPEYQRNYIDFLLKSIRKINLHYIDSINMCFITHSPFILSDIPQHNILFLQVDENEKKSLPRKESIKTFGANINDMLANGFYLQDGFMGEFAKNKLEDIIKNLNKVDKEENNSDVNEILKIIELIGEPFLREKLKEMFFNKFKELRSKRIQELEKELTKLKRYDWAKNGQQ
jgi:hypothetical protein